LEHVLKDINALDWSSTEAFYKTAS